MEIRLLLHSDGDAFYRLRLAGLQESPDAFGSTYEESAKTSAEEWATRCVPTDAKFVLGAFDDAGALVGVVGFQREQRLKSRHTASVWGMYVSPSARGQGVGRSLIRELLSRAKRLDGLEQVHLDVVGAAGPARNLYLSEGFEVIGAMPRALKLGDLYYDSEHMVYWL